MSKDIPTWSSGTIKFRLFRAFTNEVRLARLMKDFKRDPEAGNTEFGLTMQMDVLPDTNGRGMVQMNVGVHARIRETQEEFYHSRFGFAFRLTSIPEGVSIEEILDHDPNLILQFVSMSYSTARGMILEHGQGTILMEDILPTVDPKVLAVDVMRARAEFLRLANTAKVKSAPKPRKAKKPQ